MKCLNCREQLAPGATRCDACKTELYIEPSAEDIEDMMALLSDLPHEALDSLRSASRESGTADEFVRRILIGDCPNCGGSATQSSENDVEIGAAYVGRCMGCDHLFCVVCKDALDPSDPVIHDCQDGAGQSVPDFCLDVLVQALRTAKEPPRI